MERKRSAPGSGQRAISGRAPAGGADGKRAPLAAATRSRRWRALLALAVVVLSVGVLAGSRLVTETGTLAATPNAQLAEAPLVAGPEATEPEPAAPPTARYFPFLAGEDRSASVSVGDTSDGYLVGSRELAENDAVGILPLQRERNLRYGTEPLVEMIQAAGRALYQETKTRLWVGNVGNKEGGDITWSVSHNSGRDADIAFAYMNKLGEPKDPPDLIPLNGQGLAKGQDLRLDPKRTWLIIKALLAYPKAEVQYLFMADGLKTQVLMHAANSGEPAALVTHAAAVIRQPYGSAPHNDHLHLRIFCSERDVLGGCVNTGSVHPWTQLYEEARRRFVKRTSELLETAAPAEQKRAIERLALLDATDAAEAITKMLMSDVEHPDLREAAARSLARLGGPSEVPALTEHYRRERDPLVRMAITQSIGDIGGGAAGRFLASAVGKPQPERSDVLSALITTSRVGGPALLAVLPQAVDMSRTALLSQWLGADAPSSESDADQLMTQLVALEAAAKSERLEVVPALIALLADPRGIVRDRAAHALHMITNLSYYIPWQSSDPLILAKGRSRWAQAYQRSRGAPRDAWLATGFQAAGFQVREVNQSQVWELVRAVSSGSDYVSYNAQRVLMRLTKHRPPSTSWSKGVACVHWFKWVRARRDTYHVGKPPKKVQRACGSTP